jgi:dienelactone hydrolase
MITDHPVFVPTSRGPIGAIVSEPRLGSRAALLLLPGAGTAGRAGVNSVWARIAREVGASGVTVMRPDYPLEGESRVVHWDRSDGDPVPLWEVVEWFATRTRGHRLFAAGSCFGGRIALQLASRVPQIEAVAMLVPRLRPVIPEPLRRSWLPAALKARATDGPIESSLIQAARDVLARRRLLALAGELDRHDLDELERALGPLASRLEMEIVPGAALHSYHSAEAQAVAHERICAWITAMTLAPAPSMLPAATGQAAG